MVHGESGVVQGVGVKAEIPVFRFQFSAGKVGAERRCWLLVVGCWLLVVGCWLVGPRRALLQRAVVIFM